MPHSQAPASGYISRTNSEGMCLGSNSHWSSWPSLVPFTKWWPFHLALRPLSSRTYAFWDMCPHLLSRRYSSWLLHLIAWYKHPGCQDTEHFQNWQGASLCYLSSICFADVCRLDFLWATCVVTLSRSILWFCKTSSRCLHLKKEVEKKLRRAESSSEHASQARTPTMYCLSQAHGSWDDYI